MGALVTHQERVRACLWSLLFPCVLLIAALGALYFVMPAGFGGGDSPSKSGANKSEVRVTPAPVVAGPQATEAPVPAPETPANETAEVATKKPLKKRKAPATEAPAEEAPSPANETAEVATKDPLKKRKAPVATEAPAEDAAAEIVKPSKKKKSIKITE